MQYETKTHKTTREHDTQRRFFARPIGPPF